MIELLITFTVGVSEVRSEKKIIYFKELFLYIFTMISFAKLLSQWNMNKKKPVRVRFLGRFSFDK